MLLVTPLVVFVVFVPSMDVKAATPLYADENMWNILKGKSVIIKPADAPCSVGRTFCIPETTVSNSIPNQPRCVPTACRSFNIETRAITDENLGSVLYTRSLDQLEIVIGLNSTYEIFYVRLAFSGNPPSSIVIQRRVGGTRAWLPWQYYAVDCSGAFGIQSVNEALSITVPCSRLPWSSGVLHSTDAVLWNVFQGRDTGRQSALSQTALQLSGADAIRIVLAGHLVSPPQRTDETTYGWSAYGISEIGIYGRCGDGFHRSLNDSTSCEPCNCSSFGSLNQTCSSHGSCSCKINFMNQKCDVCSPGHFNTSLGCLPCNCDSLGSTAEICNEQTGRCLCRPGFTGSQCDECIWGSFLLGHLCVGCECNRMGTTPALCDRNGTCICKRFVTGSRCEACIDGFVDFSGGNPDGCSLRPIPVPVIGNQSSALPFPPDRSLNPLPVSMIPRAIASSDRNVSLTNVQGAAATTDSSTSVATFYPWLIAITVLLVIALVLLIIHFILYIRRRKSERKYSPRQIPEFLSSGAQHKHPDYARRNPQPANARLTGYFYNPEYPTDSLTPGPGNGAGPSANRQTSVDEYSERGVVLDTNGPRMRKGQLDMTREPATTGTFRPHTQSRSPVVRQNVSTISGGIVNENFDPVDHQWS